MTPARGGCPQFANFRLSDARRYGVRASCWPSATLTTEGFTPQRGRVTWLSGERFMERSPGAWADLLVRPPLPPLERFTTGDHDLGPRG